MEVSIAPRWTRRASRERAAACGGGSEQETRNPDFVRLPPAAPAGQWVLFGHIRSLARKNGRFEMRFDPAWVLSGVTAERAAVEDKVLSPGNRFRTTTTTSRRVTGC